MPTQTEIHFLDILKGIIEDGTMHPDVRMLVTGDVFEEVGWLVAAHDLRCYAHQPDHDPQKFSDIHSEELANKYSRELTATITGHSTWGYHHATIPRNIMIDMCWRQAPEELGCVDTRTRPRMYYTSDCDTVQHWKEAEYNWGKWPLTDEGANCLDAWYTSPGYKKDHPYTAHSYSFSSYEERKPLNVFRFDPEIVGPQKCQCLATELHHCYSS